MQFAIEIIFQAIFLGLAYFTGKAVLVIFAPSVGIEPFEKQKNLPSWKWRGFTYKKGKRNYFYTESIQIIGIVSWVFLGVLIFLISKYTI